MSASRPDRYQGPSTWAKLCDAPRMLPRVHLLDVRRGVEAAVVAVAAWLLCVRAHAPVHLDTARDLLLARDAAEGLARGLAGPPSSFAHLVQGAAWIHVLEVAR